MGAVSIPALTDHPGFIAGRGYPAPHAIGTDTLTVTENRLYFVPFYAPRGASIDQVRFTITTGAGAAANEVRTGIYANSAGRPGARLIDNGRTVVGTSTGDIAVSCVTILPAGWCWLAMIANRAPGGSATQPTVRSFNNLTVPQYAWLIGFNSGSVDVNASGTPAIYNDETVSDWTTYTLPAIATQSTVHGQEFPVMGVRAA